MIIIEMYLIYNKKKINKIKLFMGIIIVIIINTVIPFLNITSVYNLESTHF